MADKAELLRRGMTEEAIIDRETHPAYWNSSWPMTDVAVDLLGEKGFSHHPHLQANGIYVAVIGNDWVENGHWRMQNMLKAMERKGYIIAYDEIPDRCIMPADSIAQMRVQASYHALNAGAEWFLLVETDALMEEDTLECLMKWDFPVVAPFIIDDEHRHRGLETHLSGPILRQDHGLYPVLWTVMSVMLFKTKVFNAIGADCWGEHYGINEYVLSQKLDHVGHRIYVDTNTTVHVSRSPGRPRSYSWEEFHEKQRSGFERSRHQDRDRRPPPDYDPVFSNDPVTIAGAYEPFHGSGFKWKEPGGNGHIPKTETRAERRRRERQMEG